MTIPLSQWVLHTTLVDLVIGLIELHTKKVDLPWWVDSFGPTNHHLVEVGPHLHSVDTLRYPGISVKRP
jgi:hypothetical protein